MVDAIDYVLKCLVEGNLLHPAVGPGMPVSGNQTTLQPTLVQVRGDLNLGGAMRLAGHGRSLQVPEGAGFGHARLLMMECRRTDCSNGADDRRGRRANQVPAAAASSEFLGEILHRLPPRPSLREGEQYTSRGNHRRSRGGGDPSITGTPHGTRLPADPASTALTG